MVVLNFMSAYPVLTFFMFIILCQTIIDVFKIIFNKDV